MCIVRVWQRNFEPAWYDELGTTVVPNSLYQAHKHRRFKITLPNTDYAHEKYHE